MAETGEIRRWNDAGVAPDEEGAHLLPPPDDFHVGEDDEDLFMREPSAAARRHLSEWRARKRSDQRSPKEG